MEEIQKDHVTVVDISRTEVAGQLKMLGADFRDCLVIADCEETVRQAMEWDAAVIGYAPDGILSHVDMIVEGFEEVDIRFLERAYQRFHHIPWIILETERCIVREMTIADVDALYELYQPPKMTRYQEKLPEDRDEGRAQIQAYENMYHFYGYGMWAVVEKCAGRLIGRAGLEHLEMNCLGEANEQTVVRKPGCLNVASEQTIVPELGYLIAADKQNQGYATEVCRAILDYAREELGFSAIYCRVHKENIASLRVAEKLKDVTILTQSEAAQNREVHGTQNLPCQ